MPGISDGTRSARGSRWESPLGPGVRDRTALARARRRNRTRRVVALLAALAALWAQAGEGGLRARCWGGEPPAGTAAEPPCRFVLTRRSVAQDQGAWVVDLRVCYEGEHGIILAPSEITARLEGWVSNSRVASHAVPRLARVVVSGSSTGSGSGDVIVSSDESQRCRERVTILVWEDHGPVPSASAAPLLSVAPGAKVTVRLRIEHQHVLYGDYDPLLGVQSVELTLGPGTIRDRILLDHEQYLAQPRYTWPPVPEDRRDTRQFISAPDSLHLQAHIPGQMYYRYPERPVRYGSRMRLRFWYLIAAGTEGECRVRLAQYKDTLTSWRPLPGGGMDLVLPSVGRWTKFERILHIESEATTAALDFRIVGETYTGEMWIDDVSLEPVGCPSGRHEP